MENKAHKIIQDVGERNEVFGVQGCTDRVSGKSMTAFIKELAHDASSAYESAMIAKGEEAHMAEGATKAGLDLGMQLAEVIVSAEADRKKAIESIRMSRMALCSEVALIESAMGKIKALNLNETIRDLDRLEQAIRNPVIQKLIGIQ